MNTKFVMFDTFVIKFLYWNVVIFYHRYNYSVFWGL